MTSSQVMSYTPHQGELPGMWSVLACLAFTFVELRREANLDRLYEIAYIQLRERPMNLNGMIATQVARNSNSEWSACRTPSRCAHQPW